MSSLSWLTLLYPSHTHPTAAQPYNPHLHTVSALNFALLSFPNIPSCIAISRDPLQLLLDACPTLHPPLRFIPHDPHDPNNSYDLCLKTNQSLGVYRDILECYPGHPDPLRPRGFLPHPTSRIPIPSCLWNRYVSGRRDLLK